MFIFGNSMELLRAIALDFAVILTPPTLLLLFVVWLLK